MSKYEYERGELLIPSASFARMRRMVCESYNAWQQHCFAVAQTVHDQVATTIKGKRLPDVSAAVRQALDQAVRQETPSSMGFYAYRSSDRPQPYRPRLGENGQWAVQQTLLKTDPATRKVSLRRPLKKDFSTVALTHGAFDLGEVSLTFDAKARTVRWHVAENNHAVDRAWEEVLGQAFVQGLAQVTWTRGTGGTFLYNNEYNRDSGQDYEGGGGTMVSRRFGPLGEDPMLTSRSPRTRTTVRPRRF